MPNPPPPSPRPIGEIVAFFQRQGKTVLTLLGYSGSGYERPDLLEQTVAEVLGRHDPAGTLVNIGVTADGIGAAYGWAKARGFATSGIVSTAVLKEGHTLSRHCDFVFVVEDTAYGGYLDGRLSPVSEAMVAVSDIMVAVGGGDVVRDELIEMQKKGKPIQFIAADLNHARALAKAWSRGLPQPNPQDYQGSAHVRFGSK